VNKKPRQANLLQKLGPASIGAIMIVILTGIIFLVLAPANAIGTVALPQEVQPVTINVALAPVEITPTAEATPTATPLPEPTATPAPTPSAAPSASPPPPTATPVPPTATPLPPLPGIEPRRLRIPVLGINAAVEQVGLDSKNRMDVPRNIWNVAWYKLGPQPGQRGNAVIDGHLDGPYSAAVFWNLSKLVPGNRIYVQDDKGQEKVFEVFDVATYDFDKAPLDRIFGPSNDAQLNLITCNGTFDQGTANYDKRFVAYARLIQNP
jgi:sortase A